MPVSVESSECIWNTRLNWTLLYKIDIRVDVLDLSGESLPVSDQLKAWPVRLLSRDVHQFVIESYAS